MKTEDKGILERWSIYQERKYKNCLNCTREGKQDRKFLIALLMQGYRTGNMKLRHMFGGTFGDNGKI